MNSTCGNSLSSSVVQLVYTTPGAVSGTRLGSTAAIWLVSVEDLAKESGQLIVPQVCHNLGGQEGSRSTRNTRDK